LGSANENGEAGSAQRADGRPRLSVVVATREEWPGARDCVDSLLGQVEAVGGELILADGNGRGLPGGASSKYRAVRWLKDPGASVFHLRALAVPAARGDVVAMTEDHCVARERWCERMLRAHEAHPDIAAICGPVENGATDTLMDWASFLMTFATFMPPIVEDARDRVPPPVNLSYKRWALPEREPRPGWMEVHLIREVIDEGGLALDPSPLVAHVQRTTYWGSIRDHFHNGRTTTGLASEGRSWSELRRELRWRFRLALVLFRSTWTAMGRRGRLPRGARASLPIVFLLCCSHAAGEWVGLLAGPGHSPERLH
jgi:hypothetical protein